MQIRSIGTFITMSLLWIFSFSMIKLFPILSAAMGMHGNFLLFSMFSITGGFLIILLVPETKGKSLEEILTILS